MAVRGHLGGTFVMRRPGARWSGATARPSAKAGHIPSWRGSCGCYVLSPVTGASRWLLPLLSAPGQASGQPGMTRLVSAPGVVRPGCGPCPPPLSPIGLPAAGLFAGGEVSRADSRVRSPGTFTCAHRPAARSALDAVPEACHNPAAVWWGAFAASAVIRDQVVIVKPIADLLGQRRRRQDHQFRRLRLDPARPATMQVTALDVETGGGEVFAGLVRCQGISMPGNLAASAGLRTWSARLATPHLLPGRYMDIFMSGMHTDVASEVLAGGRHAGPGGGK